MKRWKSLISLQLCPWTILESVLNFTTFHIEKKDYFPTTPKINSHRHTVLLYFDAANVFTIVSSWKIREFLCTSQVERVNRTSAGCKNCCCSFPAVGSSLQIQQPRVTFCLFFFGQVIKTLRFHIFPVHNLSQLTGEKVSPHSKMSLTTNIWITKNNTVQVVVFTCKKKEHPSPPEQLVQGYLKQQIEFICKRKYSESLSYTQHLNRNTKQQPPFYLLQ